MSHRSQVAPGENGRVWESLAENVIYTLVLAGSLLIATTVVSFARSQDNFPPAWKAQLDSLARPVYDHQRIGGITQPIILRRDAARFSLQRGTIIFFQAVGDRVTGALFRGQGTFELIPPTALEKQQLERFTGDTICRCDIDELYFRFTDSTFEEIYPKLRPLTEPGFRLGKEPSGKSAGRIEDELYYSMGSRLLMGLRNRTDDGLFYAAIDPDDDTRYHFLIDPLYDEAVKLYRRPSTPDVHPIDLACSWPRRQDVARFGYVSADIRNNQIASRHYGLHTVIDEPSRTAVTAQLDFVPLLDKLGAVRFDLAANLKIDSVWGDRGAMYFYYNNPEVPLNYNAPFPIVGSGGGWAKLDIFWEEPLPKDSTVRISFSYHGKYLLYQFPWGDFYINEATTWYPTHDWRDRTPYEMSFEFPATREIVAVGQKLEETTMGDRKSSRWRMDYPVAYVSFNYGLFEQLDMPPEESIPRVEIYRSKNHQASLFGKDMKKKVGRDIVGALKLFTEAYGPLPFERLAATEVPAAHGQGFPQLLHLSWGSFHEEHEGKTELFRAHEVAHQWWGHLVGWKTYHDQWLSEGFAEFSGAWYVEQKYGFGKEWNEILKAWKKAILQRGGRRSWHEGPQVAPIWMGGRCSSYDSPGSYSALVYNKGAYVMHMLRMMMRDFKTGSDQHFIKMMRDFVRRFRDRSASTEDFKRVVEDHLGASMNWFFDQWVYGTEIPKLKYSSKIAKTEDGEFIVSGRIEQSEISVPFRMFMPITFDFGKKRKATFLQEITDRVTEFTSPPLPTKPKKIVFNDYRTILCR